MRDDDGRPIGAAMMRRRGKSGGMDQDDAVSVVGSTSSAATSVAIKERGNGASTSHGKDLKKCKWCRSLFGSVAWSKPDGRQCDLCMAVVLFFYGFMGSQQKIEYCERIATDDDEYEVYMERRRGYQEIRASGGNVTDSKLQAMGLSKAGPTTTVTTGHGQRTIIRDKSQVFWRLDHFKALHGEPKKESISSIIHQGVKLMGIIKPRSFGWDPEACLEIDVESYEGSGVTEEVASSSTVANREQLEKAATLAAKAVGFNSKGVKGKDGNIEYFKPVVEPEKKKKAGAEEDAEDDLLSRLKRRRLFGGSSGSCGGGRGGGGGCGASPPHTEASDEHVEETNKGKAKSMDGPASNAAKTKRQKREPSGVGPSVNVASVAQPCSVISGPKVPPSKRLREISGVLPMIEEARTFLTLLNDPNGILNCGAQQASRLKAKLETRLQPARASIYMGGPLPGVQQDPMRLLSDMRAMCPQLQNAARLCDALHPKRGEQPAVSTVLYNVVVSCKSHGLDVSSYAVKEVLLRAATEAFVSARRIQPVDLTTVQLVMSSMAMNSQPRNIHTDIFPGDESARSTVRNEMALSLSKLVFDVKWDDAKELEEHTSVAKKFANVMEAVLVESAGDLIVACNPLSYSPPAIAATSDRLQQQCHFWHHAMTVLPLGCDIFARMLVCKLQLEQDVVANDDIRDISTEVADLIGSMFLDDFSRFRNARKRLDKILGECSPGFLERQKDTIEYIETSIKSAYTYLCNQATEKLHVTFQDMALAAPLPPPTVTTSTPPSVKILVGKYRLASSSFISGDARNNYCLFDLFF